VEPRLLSSLALAASLAVALASWLPALYGSLWRPGSAAGLEQLVADVCYCSENPGSMVVRSYSLPRVVIEDGAVRGEVHWVWPGCARPGAGVIRLPIAVDRPLEVGGLTRLRLTGLPNGTVLVERE